MSRFWTQFEAYLSFRTVTANGLDLTPEADRRCTIRCIHNALVHEKVFSDVLIAMWASKTASEAYEILVKPDVKVTNQRDKDIQLPKLKTLNDFSKHVVAKGSMIGRSTTSTSELPLTATDGLKKLLGSLSA